MKNILLTLVLVLIGSCCSVQAEPLRIASGAGYKKFVEKWAAYYEQSSGDKIERIYGNMGQVSAQVEQGGGICLVIGDQSYLSSHRLPISRYLSIGTGRPVIVSRKGLKIGDIRQLEQPEFAKIAAPDFDKAIYGKAAQQILNYYSDQTIFSKVIAVGTVPRSGAYAIRGEVDASFVNKTYALANREKFGSLLEITEGFQAIKIVVGIINGCSNRSDVGAFTKLMASDRMQKEKVAAGL